MKKLQLIPVIVFFIFVFYFAIFNWSVFIQSMDADLGFAVLRIPLVMVLFIVTILFLFAQSSLGNLIESKFRRDLEKKDKEITSVKSNLYDKSAPEIETIVANLGYLDEKLDKILDKLDVEIDDQERDQTRAEEES